MSGECRPPEGTEDRTWHWLQLESEEPEIWEWSLGEWLRQNGDVTMFVQEADEYGLRYAGPILAPEEVAALRAERDQMREALEDIASLEWQRDGEPEQSYERARAALAQPTEPARPAEGADRG